MLKTCIGAALTVVAAGCTRSTAPLEIDSSALQKRGSNRPFFALWIDNAELLAKW
jgi:hypothetical protein